jgi:arylsulfatase A-like enzyme
VVLIVVDTLRADHLGAYGYERPTSSHLDAWARQGKLFEQSFATSSWTLPSFGSLFTGELPSRHGAGIRKWGRLDAGVPVLSEILREHGYATGAIVNNPTVAPEFGLDRGFDSYDYDPGDNKVSRRADRVVDTALLWIDRRDDARFFLVVHFFDPHMRYDAPLPQRGRFTRDLASQLALPVAQFFEIRRGELELDDSDREFVSAAYDEELAFVDQEIERLRFGLESRGLLDSSLVILTADHGEELFDHGGFEHGHAMWQEILHVPLVFWGPGVRPGREPVPVSLVDVVPTILDALGIEHGLDMEGRSLWPNLTADVPLPVRTLYAEGIFWGPERQAMVRWPYKLVGKPDKGLLRLVDLAADPKERSPLGLSTRLAAELHAELVAHLAAAARRRGETARAHVEDETREQLRSLGYIK